MHQDCKVIRVVAEVHIVVDLGEEEIASVGAGRLEGEELCVLTGLIGQEVPVARDVTSQLKAPANGSGN